MKKTRFGEKPRFVTMRMPESAYKELKRRSEAEQRGVAYFINDFVLKGLKMKKKDSSAIMDCQR
jgi:hypothetical protein